MCTNAYRQALIHDLAVTTSSTPRAMLRDDGSLVATAFDEHERVRSDEQAAAYRTNDGMLALPTTALLAIGTVGRH
jgi:hypothetical protein